VDGGATFGAPVTAATLSTAPGINNGDLGLTGTRAGTATPAAFRAVAWPQIVANPATGNLYLVYADKPTAAGDKADVFLRQSIDNGQTWGAPVRVNDDATTNDQFQPTLAVTPDGAHVGVFWYDRRADAANNLIDYYGELFSAAGNTLTPGGANTRISDVSFAPEFGRDPGLNGRFVGDYDAGVKAENTTFSVAWSDNRDPSAAHAGNNANIRFDTLAVPEPAGAGLLVLAAGAGLA
jgi:hypothetical protein